MQEEKKKSEGNGNIGPAGEGPLASKLFCPRRPSATHPLPITLQLQPTSQKKIQSGKDNDIDSFGIFT